MDYYRSAYSSPPPSPPQYARCKSASPPQTSYNNVKRRERRGSSFKVRIGSLLNNFHVTPPRTPRSRQPSSGSSKNGSWDFSSLRRASSRAPSESSHSYHPSTSTNTSYADDVPPYSLLEDDNKTPTGYFPSYHPYSHPYTKSQPAMDRSSFLHPDAMVTAPGKAKQIRAAKEMTQAVSDRATKQGLTVPPYDFLELIGKGAFGRVFKSRRKDDNSLVAVKIVDVDSSDYKLAPGEKDQAIKDFVNEISILRTLKDSKAKNINIIHDAFNFHSQLWIVSDYCPGGSVHTLMRACTGTGLEEKYIIAISRELATAMKYVHDAGVIHRDIKCGNILITQDGQLQLCDFGVSGVLESNVAKRTTIIGTPYWMAPELHEAGPADISYGTEIDCWAYGCTIYEMATGTPPNAKIAPHKLHLFVKNPPRLNGDQYSAALREFVEFCLIEMPDQRPDAEGIQRHPYIANSSKKYPTQSLRQLLERYAAWEQSGGQRASLWQPMGANAPTMLRPFEEGAEDDDWNFSTTEEFSDEVSSRFVEEPASRRPFDEEVSQRQDSHVDIPRYEKEQFDKRAMRGAAALARLYDENAPEYVYKSAQDAEDVSDLPFRRSELFSNNVESVIDLDDARFSMDLSGVTPIADADTIRAKKTFFNIWGDDEEEKVEELSEQELLPPMDDQKTKRATREWKFPVAQSIQQTMPARSVAKRPPTLAWSMEQAQREVNFDQDEPKPILDTSALPPRPPLLHTTTEPVGAFGDFLHPNDAEDDGVPVLSLEPPDRDSLIEFGAEFPTLSRQSSIIADEASLSAVSDATNGDPFTFEFNDQTVRGMQAADNRQSVHAHSQSEPAVADRTSVDTHSRGTSLSSDLESERTNRFENEENFHGRNISVQASAGRLRKASAADDFDDSVYQLQPPRLRPSESLLATDADTLRRGHWSKPEYKVSSRKNRSIDSDAPTSVTSDTDDYYSSRASSRQGSRDYMATPPRSAPDFRRGRRRYESEADSDIDGFNASNLRQTGPFRPVSGFRKRAHFPKPQPPEPAALSEEASDKVVMEDIYRLLGGFIAGLDTTRELLREERENGQPMNGHANGHINRHRLATGGSGSGSGSGGELGLRSRLH